MSADVSLAILAKAPIPGRVKTRLIPACGAEQAARVHAHLLCRTVHVASAAFPAERLTLWTALDHAHPLFLELAERYGIALHPQPDGDLGARLHHALAWANGPALAIGSDCPVLSPALLHACAEALMVHDASCLPAEDGGYALLGLRQAHPHLFTAIDWGSERVMTQTTRRINELGWRLACPATVWDVDRPEDLHRWQRSAEIPLDSTPGSFVRETFFRPSVRPEDASNEPK
ncbi:TIGR04282 family arsenosugar biosynthesis glycosyltransferase [Billgrantia antri]|uniref:TIGR04282 family arsenosugar biosynthesis glycosyltransferase n=1 Tax=Billgrantia antri TaxID=2846777 RepID=A0ABS6ZIE9_9GAMM|nr:TIGR04282 family arsenosugar biosynthesis glycosyltransferase [Halomonas antri]MBW6389827.1 TIGR04282 family arsenosugar biosynthesis glycosyltransferase [Halomonas antri]